MCTNKRITIIYCDGSMCGSNITLIYIIASNSKNIQRAYVNILTGKARTEAKESASFVLNLLPENKTKFVFIGNMD